MKEVDVGNESFAEIITNNSYYVDKTSFIKTVFKKGVGKVMLITRPRRFGKTLTMSTFHEFLRINPKNPNNSEDTSYQENLFKDTKIFEDKEFCNEYMGKYPVIFITLKDVIGNTYELAYQQLSSIIVNLINNHFSYLLSSDKLNDIAKMKLLRISDDHYFTKGWFKQSLNEKEYSDKNIDSLSTVQENLQSSLVFLTECLSKHHGVNPIVLIDEYDVPISKAAHYGYYNELVPVISSFLSKTLKSNQFLGKAVLTGCLRAAKESIFTGLNNLVVNSVLDDIDAMSEGIGFTKEEAYQVLDYYQLSDYKDAVTDHYDGYYFGYTHMYCPWDVMNFCKFNHEKVGKPDRVIEPNNYWINTSGNDIIEEYMGYIKPEDVEQMQALVDGNSITTVLRTSLCYGDLHYHDIADFWTLLLYTGYLTFDPRSIRMNDSTNGEMVGDLYIPNKEIRGCFNSKILNYFKNNPTMQNYTVELAKGLFTGDGNAVEQNINNLLTKYVSIRDFSTKAPKENYYHGFLNGVLVNNASLIQEQKSNFEAGNGYVDLVLSSRSESEIVILELKQTSTLKDDRILIASNAIKQIKDNKYADPYMNNSSIRHIYAYGICFYKKMCSVVVDKFK